MRPKNILVTVCGALVLVGCGKTHTPTSGGRTASYWAEVLQKEEVELRRKAAAKLGPLILIDKAALPALLSAIKDSDAEVRSATARSLGIYTGSRAGEVLPALREMAKQDADTTVREAATKAIERLSNPQAKGG
jgi:HEAT repeat protein